MSDLLEALKKRQNKDDVPEPNKEHAKAMQKGATESGVRSMSDYWDNFKKGFDSYPTSQAKSKN